MTAKITETLCVFDHTSFGVRWYDEPLIEDERDIEDVDVVAGTIRFGFDAEAAQ